MRSCPCLPSRTVRAHGGYTIIELLVALAISAIFFTSFLAVVATTLETLRTGDERTVAQQNARIALSTLMAEIRTAAEIEPRSAFEASAPGLPGLPRDDDGDAPLSNTDAWPVLARSTDASTTGYIELTTEEAGGEQYPDFRDDERPYDVRPLSPNRLTIRLNNAQYLGNTRYSYIDPDAGGITVPWDFDESGNNADNPTTADLMVTYEHQITPPRVTVYGTPADIDNQADYILDGLVKRLYVMTGSGGTPLILDTDSINLAGGNNTDRPELASDYVPDFYLLRSFMATEPTNAQNWSVPASAVENPSGNLSSASRTNGVFVPPVHLRQPIADHILDVRFRYWFEWAGRMFEVRYDPEVARMGVGGGGSSGATNGYYRYFDVNGNEMYVWSKPGVGKIDVDEADYLADPQAYIDNYPSSAFLCVNEFERGMLLFEGWRLISAVSVTLRAANESVLQDYVSSIDYTLNDSTLPEFGYGFTDFGGANLGENMVDPLYRAADSHRGGYFDPEASQIYAASDIDVFDIPEPLVSTNFEPTRFVTLQSMVAPPLLQDSSKEAQESFTLAFSVFKFDIE